MTNAPPEIVADPHIEAVKKWADKLQADDAAIIAAAITAEPYYFITGDSDFLRTRALIEQGGLRIMSPVEIIILLKSQ